MRVETYLYSDSWDKEFDLSLDSKNTLVIIFSTPSAQKATEPIDSLIKSYPNSIIIGSSGSGEIFQNEICDDCLSVAVIKFDTTRIKHTLSKIDSSITSHEDGVSLAKTLLDDQLKSIFILSDGLNVNGSQLTDGISSVVGLDIPVTGGLAGDGAKFEKTWIIADGKIQDKHICAVGFYGENFNIRHASKGGWDSIGLKRVVTKSKDNILYELDNKPALDIYKRYLGDKAADLPASGLLFPLELKESKDIKESKIRTILAVDENDKSITFAGDLPEGSVVTLMKANYNRLINGAGEAAERLDLSNYNGEEIFSIAISCVGRRLVLKSKTEDEIDAVLDILPPKVKQIGFYSYGEISPLSSGKCDLHNQTMTLTLFWENNA
jgi:hypothetical protein